MSDSNNNFEKPPKSWLSLPVAIIFSVVLIWGYGAFKDFTRWQEKRYNDSNLDYCLNNADRLYFQRWEAACKGLGKDKNCTLEDEGPGFNIANKSQRQECYERWDRR